MISRKNNPPVCHLFSFPAFSCFPVFQFTNSPVSTFPVFRFDAFPVSHFSSFPLFRFFCFLSFSFPVFIFVFFPVSVSARSKNPCIFPGKRADKSCASLRQNDCFFLFFPVQQDTIRSRIETDLFTLFWPPCGGAGLGRRSVTAFCDDGISVARPRFGRPDVEKNV